MNEAQRDGRRGSQNGGDRDDRQAGPRVRYRRLRSPTASGQSLQIPSLTQTVASWNERRQPASQIEISGRKLESLQQQGRSELLQLATQYTEQYRDVDLSQRDARSIVMSGHQPLLFHPGVWFKNFALSSVSSAVGAMPVNLVVDNDVCGPGAIKCPAFADGKASTSLVEIDAAYAAVPYEARPIVDDELFDSFADRAAARLGDCLVALGKRTEPLVSRLWQHVDLVRKSLGDTTALGATLAAGRHRLEQEAGLQTLEVPVSSMAQTETFCHFAAAIMVQQSQFNESYNARLVEYRRVHGIRSNAHPVPELEQNDGWLESPFWMWSSDQPQRRRLFVKNAGGVITLTDREGWQLQVASKDLPSALFELTEQKIALRPRALITTLYSRLVLSDLFLHGIGGAKYDQLTDLIASDVFGVTLPPFSTLTATMYLPLGIPVVTDADRSIIRQQIRERVFHPERFVGSDTAAELVNRKRAAIANAKLARLDRHHEINAANQAMQPLVADQIDSMQQKLAEVSKQIHNSRILNSREYSFCLFDQSLIEQLNKLAH